MPLEQLVQQKLENDFPGAKITVNGFSSDGAHIEVVITSEKFKNISLIQQHRLVNEALKDFLQDGSIHALKIKTQVPKDL